MRTVRAVPGGYGASGRGTVSPRDAPTRGTLTDELELFGEIGVRCRIDRSADWARPPTARSNPPLSDWTFRRSGQDDRARHAEAKVELTIDGQTVGVPEGTTILDACKEVGVSIPTLCYLETLHPVNVCRVCVVEVEGARVLVPACARKVEKGMVVRTGTDRVKHSRKMVLEFLALSVDLSTTPDVERWLAEYDCHPARYGPPAPEGPAGLRDVAQPGHHSPPDPEYAETVAQPIKIDNELYVRDYSKCILCYKCVEACGTDYQNTFAIGVAGRGFDARISTEFAMPLPDSACVYCGQLHRGVPHRRAHVYSEYERRGGGDME